jgi:dTDP-3-amino-3,4,6-trideoxy-alpha-D-glucose transaminase
MDPIIALAREEGLRVLEDAAQAHGARYRGRHVGTIGDAGTFSFYPAKNLGAWGDAGAIVTNDAQLAERARLLRSHGESPRYHHRMVGTTARLDALQAAVLTVKLPHLEELTKRRRAVAAALRSQLHGVHPVVLPAALDNDCDHVYHQFVVRAPCREAIRERLAAQGIATAVHYPIPIHRSEAYAPAPTNTDAAPCATRLADEILSLPIFPSMSEHEVTRVARAIHACASDLREPLVSSAA